MCVCATAKRRRKQAKMGYTHLTKRQRPTYRAHTAATYDKRAAQAREKRLNMQARAKRK